MGGGSPDARIAVGRGGLVAIAILGVLAASALELTVAALGLVPDSTPGSQLQDYLGHTVAFQEYGATSAAFLILGILFVVGVGVILCRSNSLGGALSTTIWLAGIVLLAVSAVVWVSVLASVDSASSNAPSMADQTYQAAVANGIVDPLTDIGWVAFATGFFLTAWLARQSKFVPGWLGIVGMLGGVGSLPIGPLPEFIGTNLFALWSFGVAALLVWQGGIAVRGFGIGLSAIGVVLIASGVALPAPIAHLLSNTPLAFFFIATGVALIWLGRRPRSASVTPPAGTASS